ncbi:hypothetical protein OG936_39105 (plasmid) [Streptomyces sp. NBC_00846]|uniref:hypothetical protein n=1 Tax=Streptomyces sp. NBC_00846 TaxID=2975849 RepID=UPI00386C7CB5|nr:hypothetical protein OG936_39105 [Streptomyces sp. NBC_00846]
MLLTVVVLLRLRRRTESRSLNDEKLTVHAPPATPPPRAAVGDRRQEGSVAEFGVPHGSDDGFVHAVGGESGEQREVAGEAVLGGS